VACPNCEARAIKTVHYQFSKVNYKEDIYRCGSKEVTELSNVKYCLYFVQSEDCKKTILLAKDM